MKQIALPALAALLLCAAPAAAQDPTMVDSKHYKTVIDNEQVRVLHITYAAGESSIMHEHPDAVFVSTTSNVMRMHMPDGSTMDLDIAANEPMWTPAGAHRPENVSGTAVSGYLIELKHSHADHDEHSEHKEHSEHTEKP